jgi:2,3-bisphosphoglycerate-dependent phosphoglycerate mutase
LKKRLIGLFPVGSTISCRILPQARNLIIVAHGNSLRALYKHLEELSDQEVMELNIPTRIPLVFELDDYFRPTAHYYLSEAGQLIINDSAH